MSCPECATSRSSGLAFCPRCGVPTDDGLRPAPRRPTPHKEPVPPEPGPQPPPPPAPGARTPPAGPYGFVITLILALLFFVVGLGGIHRMYTGKVGTGILQLITGGGFFIWQLIDIILIVTDSWRDGYGYRLHRD